MKIEEHIPLSTLTTFRVGGPARFVVTLEHEDECVAAVAFAHEQGLPLIPLGNGSNMLAHDTGVHAVFVRVGLAGITFIDQGTDVLVTAGAGASWDTLVHFAVESGWWGIENLASIPGTVGGAVVQNIGAYGAVLCDVLESVLVFDTREGSRMRFSNEVCQFGYRNSIFKKDQDRYIVLSATFRLTRDAQPAIAYKDLVQWFVGTQSPSLTDIRAAVQTIRAKKFPPLDTFGTAGSFFLNPIMTPEEAARVQQAFPAMPVFPMPEGGVKVPLAWFLEHVIDAHGMEEGGAHVWPHHALVLATKQGARAVDVRALAEKIAQKVFERLGIKIFPEVRFLE